MCTSPPCPNECRTILQNSRTKRQHMYRAYIKVRDGRSRQHPVPVGWWCPACHAFVDDIRER
jgi:hypothetical protein